MTRPDTHNPNRSVPQTIALAGGVLALTAAVATAAVVFAAGRLA